MQYVGNVIRRNLTLAAILGWKFLFSQQCIQHPKIHLPTEKKKKKKFLPILICFTYVISMTLKHNFAGFVRVKFTNAFSSSQYITKQHVDKQRF